VSLADIMFILWHCSHFIYLLWQDLVASDNIDTYLTNFCVWQHNKRISDRGLSPRWDHALLLSGSVSFVPSHRSTASPIPAVPLLWCCHPAGRMRYSRIRNFSF
jgi:hypothetical protein